MSSTWKCKECENVNSANQANCMCGEDRPAYARPSAGMSGHGGCIISGCNMPGVHSDSLKGGDRWYCQYHYPYKTDSIHCARITDELKANPPKMSGVKPGGELVNMESAEDMHKRITERNAKIDAERKKVLAEKMAKRVLENG